jgi:AAA+ superfamily predicted ATPase
MDSTERAIHELDKMIRSRVPLIYIPSSEERRIVEAIVRYAEQPVHSLAGAEILARRQVWKWTVTHGLIPLQGDTGEVGPGEPLSAVFGQETCDPQVAMESAGRYAAGTAAEAGTPQGATTNASVFLFLDLHHHVSSASEPTFQRALRDLYAKLMQTRSVAIIIAPTLIELGDVKDQVAILDWPLPDQSELTALIEAIADKLPAHIHVELNGGTTALASALSGLTLDAAETALLSAVYECGCLVSDKAIPYVIQAKREAISQVAGLEYIDHSESLNTVGGLDLLKSAVANIHQVMSPEAVAAGVEPIDGILLVGVPGCGKSLMAKAIAGGQMPCIRQNVGEQFTSMLGGTEANMRAAFGILKVIGQAVWWIDEIEKLFGTSEGETDGGTGRRVLGMLLTFMEERKALAPFILPVVTANDVSKIPPELLNRFELIFFVDLPDLPSCEEIVGIHLAKRQIRIGQPEIEALAAIAHSRQLNGREIERAVKAARRRNFTTGDSLYVALKNSLENFVGVAHTMPDQIDAVRSWGRKHALPASSRQTVSVVAPATAQLLL